MSWELVRHTPLQTRSSCSRERAEGMLDTVVGETGEDEREEREMMIAAHLDRRIDGTATGRCC